MQLRLRDVRLSNVHFLSASSAAALQPPAAARKPKQLSMHNDIREDPYYWLRDDDRTDPAVQAQLLGLAKEKLPNLRYNCATTRSCTRCSTTQHQTHLGTQTDICLIDVLLLRCPHRSLRIWMRRRRTPRRHWRTPRRCRRRCTRSCAAASRFEWTLLPWFLHPSRRPQGTADDALHEA